MRTPIAVAIAISCGIIGGGLAVDAQHPNQAFWYDHASSILPFLPLFLLARSWKWLICGIPGLIAGAMMIAGRDDLVNRWPEVSRGPAFAMIVAGLLRARFLRSRIGRATHAVYLTPPVVRQVKVIGILILIHGILVLILTGIMIVSGMSDIQRNRNFSGIGGMMTLAFAAMILPWGVLNAIGGVRVISFKNRVLGLVALFSNILAFCGSSTLALGAIANRKVTSGERLATLYLMVFGALAIYGLVVLFNSRVSRTFKIVSQGATLKEAVRRSTQSYGDVRDDYEEMPDSRREREDGHGRRRAQDDGFRRDLDRDAGL